MVSRLRIQDYKNNLFNYNYIFFCITLVIGLSTSEFLMSLSSICLVLNWLLEGKFKEKFQQSKSVNHLPLLLIVGYFFSCLWLLNTTNYVYAFNDLKIKLPMLLFPLILGTIKLSKKQIKIIFSFFILGLLVSTSISFLVYLKIIPIEKSIDDIRNISIFISHIRLSLLICFALISLIIFQLKKQQIFRPEITLLTISWFIFFLILLQAITGYFVCLGLVVFFVFRAVFKSKNIKNKLLILLLFIAGFIFVLGYTRSFYNEQFRFVNQDVLTLDTHSKSGEVYQHKKEDRWTENGNRVWFYVAPKELKTEWQKKSNIPFDSLDAKGQPIWGTLYRYLTSKNLRKDKEGFLQLSSEEILLVELGQTNCCENRNIIRDKLKQIIFQYERYKTKGDPNGHSLTQRVYYLKAGVELIKKNPFLGVGIGDTHDEFLRYYERTNSVLKGNNRKRVHNQFVSVAVSMGFLGLIGWAFFIYYPFFILGRKNLFYSCFILIVSLSFLTDNTLERQAGVMFYSFFNALILFQIIPKKKELIVL